jgi:hypothetical protein
MKKLLIHYNTLFLQVIFILDFGLNFKETIDKISFQSMVERDVKLRESILNI